MDEREQSSDTQNLESFLNLLSTAQSKVELIDECYRDATNYLELVKAEQQNIRAANSIAEEERSTIRLKFDSDATAIQNTKTQAEQIYKEIEQVYEKAKTYYSQNHSLVDGLKTEFNNSVTEYTTRANEKNDVLTKEQDKLIQKIESLTNIHNDCVEFVKLITSAKVEAESIKNNVESDITAIKESSAKFSNLLSDSLTLQKQVVSTHTEMEQHLKEVKNHYSEITLLKKKLLAGEVDATGKIIAKSIEDEINTLYLEQKNKYSEMIELNANANTKVQSFLTLSNEQIQQFIMLSTQQYQELQTNLTEEIRSLLPGAGAAGLSSAYVQAKSRYGSIEYDKEVTDIAKWAWLNKLVIKADKLFHYLVGNFSTLVYYVMFLLPLFYMFHHFEYLFKNYTDIDIKTLAFKFILSAPLGLISWFGFCSIRLNRRLYEEYNHKQRVMQLYHSFKQEIDEHGSSEHKKALIGMMISAVQDKPSLAMHKYDQGLEDAFKSFLSRDSYTEKGQNN